MPKMGIGLRMDHFFVGSDDMLLFIVKKQTGANIYMGCSIVPGKISIHFHRKMKMSCDDCNTQFNWGNYK